VNPVTPVGPIGPGTPATKGRADHWVTPSPIFTYSNVVDIVMFIFRNNQVVRINRA